MTEHEYATLERQVQAVTDRLTRIESALPRGRLLSKALDGHHHDEVVRGLDDGVDQGWGFELDVTGGGALTRSGRRLSVDLSGIHTQGHDHDGADGSGKLTAAIVDTTLIFENSGTAEVLLKAEATGRLRLRDDTDASDADLLLANLRLTQAGSLDTQLLSEASGLIRLYDAAGTASADLRLNDLQADGSVLVDTITEFTPAAGVTLADDVFIANLKGVVIGHTAQIDFGATPEFQVLGTGTPDASMGFARFENNASGPDVRFLKSRGATIGTNTIVQDGDTLGRFRFQGADTGDFNTTAAQISAEVDGVPALNDIPGRLIFTTRTSGGSLSEKMRLDNAGHLGIGGTPATSAILELSSTTGALLSSRMTTTQRNALTAVDGMILYNSTDTQVQGRVAGAWVDLGASGGGGGNTLDEAYDEGGAGVGSDIIVSDGAVVLKNASVVDVLQLEVTGDANPKWKIELDGKQSWGAGGASAVDTTLYRGAANQLKTDDDMLVLGAFRAGEDSAPVTGEIIRATDTFTSDPGAQMIAVRAKVESNYTGGVTTRNIYGLFGGVDHLDNGAHTSVIGLFFQAASRGTGTVQQLFGIDIEVAPIKATSTDTVTAVSGIKITFNNARGIVTTGRGVHIRDFSKVSTLGGSQTDGIALDIDEQTGQSTNAYAIRAGDVSAGTIARILQLGPSITGGHYMQLRGSGEWTAAAEETPLYLGEGVTPTMRQVKVESTREEWLTPPLNLSAFSPGTGAVGDWSHATLTALQECYFIWHAPADFSSLTEFHIVLIPDATETIDADIDTSISATGEAHDNDTAQSLNQSKSVTLDELTEWDISGIGSLFSGIAAGDYVAVRFQSDDDTLRILGARVVYEVTTRYMHLV